MESGDAHLGTWAAGPAAWTKGVVSPRRSSAAGLCTASKHKRGRSLFGPSGGAEHRGVFGADHEHRRLLQGPPVGAPGAGRCPREDPGEILGGAAAVVGDRQWRVAADESDDRLAGPETALDVQRLPGT